MRRHTHLRGMCPSSAHAVWVGSMKGGELFDRIVDKGHFTEADAAGVTAKLFSAIKCARRPSPGCWGASAHAVRLRSAGTCTTRTSLIET